MSDLEQFRRETRAWLEANCPPGARGPGYVPIGSTRIPLEPDTQLWLERMVEKGWTTPTWPKEYGGAGLDKDEYKILIEELQRTGARAPALSGDVAARSSRENGGFCGLHAPREARVCSTYLHQGLISVVRAIPRVSVTEKKSARYIHLDS